MNDKSEGTDEYFDPWKDRHPSSLHMMTMLRPNPNLPEGLPKNISKNMWAMAYALFNEIEDGPELTAGLRKLLEAKDCFVRASLNLEPVDYRDR